MGNCFRRPLDENIIAEMELLDRKKKSVETVFNRRMKIILVGDSNTGKTSIMERHCDKTFRKNAVSSTSSSIRIMHADYEGEEVQIALWDIPGSEFGFKHALHHARNADAIVFVYDVINKKSLHNLLEWSKKMRFLKTIHDTTPKIVVGNKIDLNPNSMESLPLSLVESLVGEIWHLRVSAKTGENMDKFSKYIDYLAERIIDMQKENAKH